MTWISAMLVVAAFVALVALSGVRVKGGRPAGRTHLMSAARVVLVLLAAGVVYATWAG